MCLIGEATSQDSRIFAQRTETTNLYLTCLIVLIENSHPRKPALTLHRNMFITLIHLACDTLTRLIALDGGDGLLNFKTVLQPIPRDYEGTNAPLIIAIVLCSGVLQFLVTHPLPRERKDMTDFLFQYR